MAGVVKSGHLSIPEQPPVGQNRLSWRWARDSDAGQIAALLFQKPFQVLLRARDYIADPE
jgi:hypothetical protein